MRDAQSLLEQLLSFGGDKLTADVVHGILGTAADDRVVELAAAILAKDGTRALGLVAQCADEGLQLGELLDQLIDYWRGLMLLNCSGGEVGDLNLADHHQEAVKEQARALNLDTILAGLDVLTTTKSRLRTTSHGQVLLEVAVIRLSRLDQLMPLAQLAQWVSQPGTVTSVPSRLASGEASKKNGMIPLSESARPSLNGSAATQPAPRTALPIDGANLSLIWDKVKTEVGVMFAGMLSRAGLPAIFGPKALVLRFPGQYNHAYEYCRDSGRAQHLETVLRDISGQEWSLRFELDASAPATELAAPVSNRERERRALEMPLLSRIQSQLGGRLLKLDEGFGENSPTDEPGEST